MGAALAMSYKGTLKKRVTKLRKQHASPRVKVANDTAVSLRRKIAEEPGGLVGFLTKPLPNMQKLSDKLKRAQMTIPAKVFVLRSLLICIIGAVAAFGLGKNPMLGFGLGIIIGFWLPMKYINFRINSYTKKLLKIFPDAIDLIVRGLRSGLPVAESMNMVGQDIPDPIGSIFRTVTDSMKLGVPMDKALQDMARTLHNTEFNFFVTSIILQRETGGNLGEILSNLGDVLRKRYMMQMKIKAMTSEARASAWIVGSLPVIVSIATLVMSPGYMDILWEDYRGNIAFASAVGMLFLGVWTMKRMAKFEI